MIGGWELPGWLDGIDAFLNAAVGDSAGPGQDWRLAGGCDAESCQLWQFVLTGQMRGGIRDAVEQDATQSHGFSIRESMARLSMV